MQADLEFTERSFADDKQYSEQDNEHGAEHVEEQAEPQSDAQQVEEYHNLAARRRDQAPCNSSGAQGASCNCVTAAKRGCGRQAQS